MPQKVTGGPSRQTLSKQMQSDKRSGARGEAGGAYLGERAAHSQRREAGSSGLQGRPQLLQPQRRRLPRLLRLLWLLQPLLEVHIRGLQGRHEGLHNRLRLALPAATDTNSSSPTVMSSPTVEVVADETDWLCNQTDIRFVRIRLRAWRRRAGRSAGAGARRRGTRRLHLL